MSRVSIVIPALNPKIAIDGTLRSVLQQTWRDFEVLLVDGEVEARSPTQQAALLDRRIRVIAPSGDRVASARNAGIRAARAPLIAFLDAGDRWHPDKLALHVAHLAARQEVGVSYSQSAFIDEAGRSLPYQQRPKLRRVRARDVFLRNPVGNGSAAVVRRHTLDQIAFTPAGAAAPERCYFDESLRASDDVECWTRIALTTRWRFEGLASPLTLFRAPSDGLHEPFDRQLAEWDQVVQRIAAYAPFFSRRWAPVARGYQLRYLARCALREGRTGAAWDLLGQALWQHPGLLLSDAPRTLSTLAAALLQATLPRPCYARIENLAMRWATQWSPQAQGAEAR